jgi:hypothetical protein
MDKNISDTIYDYSDKVVQITGASSGIDRACRRCDRILRKPATFKWDYGGILTFIT